MVFARGLQLLVLASLTSVVVRCGAHSHLVIAPQSPVLEIGTNFTATCMIINRDEVTADDCYWNLSKTTVPKDQYTRVNRSALNVTIPITSETSEWLFCLCKDVSHYVALNKGKFIHGIWLEKGYRPTKPVNLSCEAVQEEKSIFKTITCEWDSSGSQSESVPTTYTLIVKKTSTDEIYNISTQLKRAELDLDTYPNHMNLDVWVTARNKLGTVESDHLIHDANYFVKPNPPSDVQILSENGFSTSLLINWIHPINKVYVELKYQIRFAPRGSHQWTYVPLMDTAKYIQSFRLQNLQPDTKYVIQVRCKNSVYDYGYWSDWSTNATNRTPEDRPTSKPDLWRIDEDNQQWQIISKDPVFSNGKIKSFEIRIESHRSKEWGSIPVNRSDADSSTGNREITFLKKMQIADDRSVKVYVNATNSVGKSPEGLLFIPAKAQVLAPVEDLKVWPEGGQLWVEWNAPKPMSVQEYVVEWVSGGWLDWQRENKSTRRTAIKGILEKFVCYNVSVYPIYSGWLGKPARTEAYLEQQAPLRGPNVKLKGDPGRNEAELVWEEIPLHSRGGFITNYTIHYSSGAETHNRKVPANITSYRLTGLSGGTKYDTWIEASTIRGSTNGSNHSFTTLKYAPGEIEGIVVGVSLGCLFVIVTIMLFCLYKKDVLKENFWPQIPNPGESTIGNWSPDYPLRAEPPKENCLSGISVLDVHMCDAKCVFEEDKTSLSLKKDKYLSEEHSSGIGGSSCMSSPRQSVSDSDEGGDMADTTSSTVQYSSVVASSGYKGQTPSSQPQQSIFSRSESTQPLLDSEENPDMMVQEGSRQFQHFARQPRFAECAGNEDTADFDRLRMEPQEANESLDFCPLEEDNEQIAPPDRLSAEWLPVKPASSYMPQLGGYRPQ
ncbi:interleukin-6 receptor subunit beta isoform X2 [Parambassis ranga]|uniref:Interleukin-6 receptor subunit beta isoform X2 n=1 Tax=Parambassis ranga TaxID=210632 RepID=A0A6P7JAC2_9TELE|nr:interleukin-6 receptor subunit beta isoform X2 [Parambassis ranga]